jgi:hypothetical protein
MKAKKIHEHGGQRTFALVFDKGDEAMAGLVGFAREHEVGAAQITAIGAFSDATLGYFDRQANDYKKIPIDEQVEVLSLIGDIAEGADGPAVHVHVVVGRADGSTRGGHLVDAHVWPTLEVVVVESPAHLKKKTDPETKLALISL